MKGFFLGVMPEPSKDEEPCSMLAISSCLESLVMAGCSFEAEMAGSGLSEVERNEGWMFWIKGMELVALDLL
jgi:hypothetical protein